jgi:hypothetical protein
MKPVDVQMDEGFSVLKSVLQLTQTLRRRTAENDLDAVEALLEKRRKLLDAAVQFTQNLKNDAVREELEVNIVGILKAIRHEDKALLESLVAKKHEVLVNLQACNNAKLLSAYTH